MTSKDREILLNSIAGMKAQIEDYFGEGRHRYLLGLREGITMCCHIDPCQKLGDIPELIEFAQFVEDYLDRCYKDKTEDR